MIDRISHPPSESQQTLERFLDNLLEHYLSLLNQYQTLQEDLTKSLSTGFLSLTKANFTSPNRIRYGQDFYDNRMQASMQVTINSSKPYITTNAAMASPATNYSKSQPPIPSADEDLKEHAVHQEEDSSVPKSPHVHRDPIKWFGLLVPPDLRSAQANFNAAFKPGVIELANVALEMKEAEVKIWKLREAISKSR